MIQSSLFDGGGKDEAIIESFPIPDGEISLCRHWMPPEKASSFFDELQEQVQWEQSVIHLHGKSCPIPRLNAWYGDPDSHYGYSGLSLKPHPWIPPLLAIKESLEATVQHRFNSVLVNLYRDGRDSVSWHSDNEPELGQNPVIASVSLGGERRFTLKHRRRRDLNALSIDLPAGSLLVMAGATQHHWLHQIPKTTKQVQPRINLTFRHICG